jgi:hypothetical protein
MNDESTVRQWPDPPTQEAHTLAGGALRVRKVPSVVLTGDGRLNQQGSSKKG